MICLLRRRHDGPRDDRPRRGLERPALEVAGGAWFVSHSDIPVSERIDAPTACKGLLELPAAPPARCAACRAEQPLEDALDLN
jgi:hypothetical protein